MKSFRWAAIGQPAQREHYQCLSQYLNEKGFANTFEAFDVAPEEFENSLEQIKKDFDAVRVESPFGEKAVSQFTHLPALMVTIKSCDALICRQGTWWPENLLFNALYTLLATQQANLDFSSSVLIVGAGASARSSVAAAVRMGFFKINVTDQFDERGQAMVEDVKRAYFNVQVTFTPQNVLMALPGVHSLVINCTPFVESNEILSQLYYFNFMQAGGLVVDYTRAPAETPLMKEARGVGGRVINGISVATYVDQIWAERHLNFQLDRSDYQAYLGKHMAELSTGCQES